MRILIHFNETGSGCAKPALEQAGTRFFKEEYSDVPVPVCLRDHILVTLAWLKRPQRTPDFPRKKVIADCYAALNPKDALWRKYLHEIDRLKQRNDISEEDYYLLRFSTEARKMLMDLTLGDPDAFAEGTINQVLDRAKATVRADTEKALNTEISKRIAVERKLTETMLENEAQRQAQRERLRFISVRAGAWIARTAFALIVLLLALGTYLTFPSPFPTLPIEWAKLITPALFIFLAIWSLVNLAHGTSVSQSVRKIEIVVTHLIEKVLLRIITPYETTHRIEN